MNAVHKLHELLADWQEFSREERLRRMFDASLTYVAELETMGHVGMETGQTIMTALLVAQHKILGEKIPSELAARLHSLVERSSVARSIRPPAPIGRPTTVTGPPPIAIMKPVSMPGPDGTTVIMKGPTS